MGVPIGSALSKQGQAVGKQRVDRLMRQAGLRAKTVKKWRATTQSPHRLPLPRTPTTASSRLRLRIGCGPETTYGWTRGLVLSGSDPRPLLARGDWLDDGSAFDGAWVISPMQDGPKSWWLPRCRLGTRPGGRACNCSK